MSYADRLQKLVEYQTNIRNALEAKGATISSDATLKDFPSAVDTITGDYTGPTPVDIMENGWAPYYSLVTNTTKIASYAFVSTSLSEVNFPYCSIVGESAFYFCLYLKNAYFPECKSIEDGAFDYCMALSSIFIPKCEYIGSRVFNRCKLYDISLPHLTNLGSSAMADCNVLRRVYLPELTSCSDGTFYYCRKLYDVYIPKVSLLSGGVFYVCDQLSTLRLHNIAKISCATYNPTFENCYNLRSLYLPASSVCTLTASVAFSGTPIVGYWHSSLCTEPSVYGSIFVPMSLIDAYKTATNWAYHSSRIAGLVNFSATNLSESDTIITAVDGKVFSDEMEVPDTNFTYSVYSKYPKYTGSQDDVGENSTINIALPTDGVKLTVNTTPEDAVVTITEDGFAEITTKEKLFNSGDMVECHVSVPSINDNSYYADINKTINIEQDTYLDIPLEHRSLNVITLNNISSYPDIKSDIMGNGMFVLDNSGFVKTATPSGYKTTYFTKYFIYKTIGTKSKFKAKIKRDNSSNDSYLGVHFTINKNLDNNTYTYQDLRKKLPITDDRVYDVYLDKGNIEYSIDIELEANTEYYVQFLVANSTANGAGSGCYGYITDMTLYYDGGPVE